LSGDSRPSRHHTPFLSSIEHVVLPLHAHVRRRLRSRGTAISELHHPDDFVEVQGDQAAILIGALLITMI
jgi:hypothetical protein